ncbi:helix-turn-helix domain-containing protein [Companilactobacillus mishanensis]|uniref:Helix-turn-helix domain-containing protein n=1 Tax=Companilactobacillus mishanensis TaxID=2486008 RepID=A0A5P0ZFB1_9LACO|nr:helix-turn-helix domain-containing protein [Companilactobacillus mishanensis]MQS51751.1 helix-turn-helix domain-containing protein [Companilactobacillus mishanensis]
MKYTNEQQTEIAQYAIKNDNDYKATGEKYGISYQQVAAWVRKYNKNTGVADKGSSKKKTTAKKATTTKKASQSKTSKKISPKKNDKKTSSSVASKKEESASTLDVLSRRDPVLEKQLEDVKRRLGLI